MTALADGAHYDLVVIGSSPLLLLEALSRKREGKTVAIVEEADSLGGAWRVDTYTLGDEKILHECACHLIEWQMGGYELLEKLSGYPFDVLKPQPVKIREAKRRVALYTSRWVLVRNYLYSWLSIAYALFILPLGWLGLFKTSRRQGVVRVRRSIMRMAQETVLRLPGVLQFDGVRAPRGGFARYISYLNEELRRHEICVANVRAKSLTRDRSRVRVRLSDGRSISGSEIALGESAIISAVDSSARDKARFSEFHHVLIGIPASAVKIRNSYIHFADNKIFHRLTYVDEAGAENSANMSIFLLQLRCKSDEIGDFEGELAKALTLYPIATSLNGLRTLKVITSHHLSSGDDGAWRGFADENISVIPTIGDLSRNAMLREWKRVK